MTTTSPPSSQERIRLRNQRLQRSKLLAVVAVVACILVATIGTRLSDPEKEFRVIPGKLDEKVMINGAELTVSDVRVGQILIQDEAIEAKATGIFVQIQIDLANPTGTDKAILGHSRLLSGDRVYKTYSSLNNIGAEPGYGETTDFLYEVDPAAIDDLTLEIWTQGFLFGYHDRVRVHLGITPENADRWREAAQGGMLTERRISASRVLQ
ncbi:hypothetical protein [Microlunatus sp. GCM10028923]|uniref:hypothetical protein n=1 Tax=Microlunatus sp. GCM10028923 TaxID=3273400 RepID=UPI0036080071